MPQTRILSRFPFTATKNHSAVLGDGPLLRRAHQISGLTKLPPAPPNDAFLPPLHAD